MKLGALLIERSNVEKAISELTQRINASGRIQEGDEPAEDTTELKKQLDESYVRLTKIISIINKVNYETKFNDKYPHLIDAIVARDILSKKAGTLKNISSHCQPGQQQRYGRAEIKFVTTISVPDYIKETEALNKQKTELNNQIQEVNWKVDVPDIV
ncbi:hypothetical protein AKO1_004160 [Acrasis kona]|uniref:Septicolysin n=1 Tax=Acrasis kona TaxID=1008807 RepID=A0AAW2ZCE3_9EUKA